MKTMMIAFVSTCMLAMHLNLQDKITAKATYDGYYDGIYSFTLETEGNEDFGETIEFNEISIEILKQYDLKSDTFEGEVFTITYTKEEEIVENEEGEEEVELTYTLVSIKKT